MAKVVVAILWMFLAWTAAAEPVRNPAASSAASAEPAVEASPIELAFWDGVKDSREVDALMNYLEAYPDGRFAALAKVRIRELSGE